MCYLLENALSVGTNNVISGPVWSWSNSPASNNNCKNLSNLNARAKPSRFWTVKRKSHNLTALKRRRLLQCAAIEKPLLSIWGICRAMKGQRAKSERFRETEQMHERIRALTGQRCIFSYRSSVINMGVSVYMHSSICYRFLLSMQLSAKAPVWPREYTGFYPCLIIGFLAAIKQHQF